MLMITLYAEQKKRQIGKFLNSMLSLSDPNLCVILNVQNNLKDFLLF